ncbi:MAG: (E)-4-hydroxy-3-methylbut-2-enyl-diphosphate synthase [Chlamydiae bacterium]|nr:(E)-4-hydroxy-3-methylbut-2-enyl-diphosphate synthase [Chlamydiota bacterium]
MNDYPFLSTPRLFKTREVKVGKVGIGGDNPVRIQSMTTSNTRDVDQTIDQVIRLADAGCEIVRMTVQGIKEAESCEHIKSRLIQKGYDVPLVADIHFYPPAAMRVVDFVDKVRINPGNFADKRAQFKKMEYDDASYLEELQKIEETFAPLVIKCKELKKAIRIGTNHGSLSDRIMNRYGDSPSGMVESALEFARVARAYDFHDMIFSMKASNPKIMIEAYRLLVHQMKTLGWDYPLHLGVTEAGEGEDGRVKSSIGMGTLLLDGIGDTIRISLTEDPWKEIDPCRRLRDFVASYPKQNHHPIAEQFHDESRKIQMPALLHPQGSVIMPITDADILQQTFLEDIDCFRQFGKIQKGKSSADAVIAQELLDPIAIEKCRELSKIIPVIHTRDDLDFGYRMYVDEIPDSAVSQYVLMLTNSEFIDGIENNPPLCILFNPPRPRVFAARNLYSMLKKKGIMSPIILAFSYVSSKEDLIIHSSSELGCLLVDRLAEGVCLQYQGLLREKLSLSFGIMQACRLRTVKTEFISCPGCGRTLFELQAVSRRIREKTSHLPGVKIAIMGCIVNGPGEMADADFGYVGSRPGKIDLYVGKNCVEKNIDFENADDRLIELIKQHGRWIDP